MANHPHPISTAFWTYVIPMTATRAWKVGLTFCLLFIASAVLIFMSGIISSSWVFEALTGMRHFLVMVGLPVGAILLSEIPIRDGITHRTLLYPLLGPVPRMTQVLVRFAVTSMLLAIGTALLLILVRALLRDGFGFLPQELLAVALGSFAYVTLFGFIHLYNRRGLITGLLVLFFIDMPLGRLPFSLRNVSPFYHLGVVSEQQESMQLPVALGHPETSVLVSSLILIAIAVLFGAAIALGFNRKNLGDLC